MGKKSVSVADLGTAEPDFIRNTISPSHEDIAILAYALWEERGGGDGGAEQDWFEAERQLRSRRTNSKPVEQPVSVEQDDFPVSSIDELGNGRTLANRPRKLGEFKPTNSPLSAADLEHRRGDPRKKQNKGWVPRTTENINELAPIPEDKPVQP